MRLDELGYLTDENVHPDVTRWLRSRGLDVADVWGESLAGKPDRHLLNTGMAERRVILTHDSDFGTLAVARQEAFFGIIYVRPGHVSPAHTIATLEALFQKRIDVEVPFLLVADRSGAKVRVRLRVVPA